MKAITCLTIAMLLNAAHARAGEKTPDALRAEVEGLRAAKVAWRGIAWKTCLLDGLAEGRARGKPVLLWVFIDRPCDDARC